MRAKHRCRSNHRSGSSGEAFSLAARVRVWDFVDCRGGNHRIQADFAGHRGTYGTASRDIVGLRGRTASRDFEDGFADLQVDDVGSRPPSSDHSKYYCTSWLLRINVTSTMDDHPGS